MHRILSANASLAQHIEQIAHAPEVYRPTACPYCGVSHPWLHGYYERKADRDVSAVDSLNPVPVPRFCCNSCGRTCSRLPLCIAPRRWHSWAVQQRVLLDLLAGASQRYAAICSGISRHTARRCPFFKFSGMRAPIVIHIALPPGSASAPGAKPVITPVYRTYTLF